jgi:putative PIN family toxin of toxin-antitoxin system
MRVVFDTNVYVSALVFPGGRADAALRRAIEREHLVLISKPMVGELLGVLARKFARDGEELARVALFVDDLCETVAPHVAVADLRDEADNRILECALAGSADRIVTGDRATLDLGAWRGIRIMTVAAFLDE